MGNCLSSETCVNRRQADKDKADKRGVKTRQRRSKRRPSLEGDIPVDENLTSSPYMTTPTTTATTPNPLGSRVNLAAHPGAAAQQEASSNHHQQQNCEEEECEDDCPNPIAPPQHILPNLGGEGTGIDPLSQSSDGARPQRVTQRALTLHQRSLALMKSAPSAPSEGLMRPPSVFDSEDDDCGSSTDDFSSLESERLSWYQVGQEELNTIQPAIATPSNKSERSNKSGSNKSGTRRVSFQTPRKGSRFAAFHARRRIGSASWPPYRATQ